MARIAGVNIPTNKRVVVALQYIHGIGARRAKEIVKKVNIPEARRAKVMCGPLFTTQDLYEDDHFRNRGFWQTARHPEMGEVEFPGRPFIMQEGGWEVRRTAPLLGQHTEEVLSETGLPADQVARYLVPIAFVAKLLFQLSLEKVVLIGIFA